MKPQIICQTSNTQRVVAESHPDGSWLLSKEWRKNADEEWIQGKGISLPVINGQSTAQKLGRMLLGGDMEGAGENGTSDPNESFN